MRLVGRSDMVAEPWFAGHTGRLEHQDELDAAVGSWIAERDAQEVVDQFAEAGAAIAPILDIAGIFEDPQFQARETITSVEHPVLGPVRMPNVVARLSKTPGRVATAGPGLGEHNCEVLGALGYGPDDLAELARAGVIAENAT